MIRYAIGGLLLAALSSAPAVAGEKNAPKLTQGAKDGARITQENIVKMKLKTVQPAPQTPLPPSVGGPPAPPPPAPPGP